MEEEVKRESRPERKPPASARSGPFAESGEAEIVRETPVPARTREERHPAFAPQRARENPRETMPAAERKREPDSPQKAREAPTAAQREMPPWQSPLEVPRLREDSIYACITSAALKAAGEKTRYRVPENFVGLMTGEDGRGEIILLPGEEATGGFRLHLFRTGSILVPETLDRLVSSDGYELSARLKYSLRLATTDPVALREFLARYTQRTMHLSLPVLKYNFTEALRQGMADFVSARAAKDLLAAPGREAAEPGVLEKLSAIAAGGGLRVLGLDALAFTSHDHREEQRKSAARERHAEEERKRKEIETVILRQEAGAELSRQELSDVLDAMRQKKAIRRMEHDRERISREAELSRLEREYARERFDLEATLRKLMAANELEVDRIKFEEYLRMTSEVRERLKENHLEFYVTQIRDEKLRAELIRRLIERDMTPEQLRELARLERVRSERLTPLPPDFGVSDLAGSVASAESSPIDDIETAPADMADADFRTLGETAPRVEAARPPAAPIAPAPEAAPEAGSPADAETIESLLAGKTEKDDETSVVEQPISTLESGEPPVTLEPGAPAGEDEVEPGTALLPLEPDQVHPATGQARSQFRAYAEGAEVLELDETAFAQRQAPTVETGQGEATVPPQGETSAQAQGVGELSTLLIAAGRAIFASTMDATGGARTLQSYLDLASQPLGSLRSIAAADLNGRRTLLVGARRGLYTIDFESRRVLVYPIDAAFDPETGVNSAVAFQGALYATHSQLGLLRWNIAMPERPAERLLSELTHQAPTVRSLFVDDGYWPTFAAGPGIVAVEHGPSPQAAAMYSGAPSNISLIVSRETRFYAACEDGSIVYWEKNRPFACQRRARTRAPISAATCSNDGRSMVLCTRGLQVRVFDLDSGVLARYDAPQEIRFAREYGRHIFGVARNRSTLYLWESFGSGRPVMELPLPDASFDVVGM